MKSGKIVDLRAARKKNNKTHTIDSASIFSIERELTMEELELVVGGMDYRQFRAWRARMINENR